MALVKSKWGWVAVKESQGRSPLAGEETGEHEFITGGRRKWRVEAAE